MDEGRINIGLRKQIRRVHSRSKHTHIPLSHTGLGKCENDRQTMGRRILPGGEERGGK
jgi:hypothetical protein